MSVSHHIDLAEICKYQTCEHPETIKLDLVSLLFRIFIKMEERKILPTNHYIHARDAIFLLNPDLFKEVEEKRFKSSNFFTIHEPTSMSVKLFTRRLDEYFSSQIKDYCVQLEKDLLLIPDCTNGDATTSYQASTEMMAYMHDFCREFFVRVMPEISNAWRVLKQLHITNPEDDEESCLLM